MLKNFEVVSLQGIKFLQTFSHAYLIYRRLDDVGTLNSHSFVISNRELLHLTSVSLLLQSSFKY